MRRTAIALPVIFLLLGSTFVPRAPAAPTTATPTPAAPTTPAAATKTSVSITFLTVAAARKVVADPAFFSHLEPNEMAAMLGRPVPGKTLARQRVNCRRLITRGVRPFTANEKTAIRKLLHTVIADLHGDYPLIAQTPWRLIKLDDRFFGALPHTRGNCIVFPQSAIDMFVAVENTTYKPALLNAADLLLHEKTHVIQRAHPRRFADLYTRLWHFTHAKKIITRPWLTAHQMTNPDGPDIRWIHRVTVHGKTRWIWPRLILDGTHNPPVMPADLRLRAITLAPVPGKPGTFKVVTNPDGKPLMQPLNSVRPYARIFGGSRNIYHPNEAAADMFAKLAVLTDILPTTGLAKASALPASQPWQQFQHWCKTHLNAPAAPGTLPGSAAALPRSTVYPPDHRSNPPGG